MEVLKDELVSTHTLEIKMDITKDDTEEVFNDYRIKKGYEVVKENLNGNILTVVLVKIVTEYLF